MTCVRLSLLERAAATFGATLRVRLDMRRSGLQVSRPWLQIGTWITAKILQISKAKEKKIMEKFEGEKKNEDIYIPNSWDFGMGWDGRGGGDSMAEAEAERRVMWFGVGWKGLIILTTPKLLLCSTFYPYLENHSDTPSQGFQGVNSQCNGYTTSTWRWWRSITDQ